MQIKFKPLRRQGERSRLSRALSGGSLKKDRLVGKFKIYATGTWNYPAKTDQFYLKMSSNTGLWNLLFHRPAIC